MANHLGEVPDRREGSEPERGQQEAHEAGTVPAPDLLGEAEAVHHREERIGCVGEAHQEHEDLRVRDPQSFEASEEEIVEAGVDQASKGAGMAKPIAGAVQPLLRDLDHLEVVVVKGKPPREDGCQ